jgi:hypothetical protein
MRIFGHTWSAPVCDGKTAEPTPVGELCIDCHEPVREGECGYIMACLHADGTVTWQPQHRECGLLHVIGHSYDLCTCTDYQGLTERAAALRLWEEFTHGMERSG